MADLPTARALQGWPDNLYKGVVDKGQCCAAGYCAQPSPSHNVDLDLSYTKTCCAGVALAKAERTATEPLHAAKSFSPPVHLLQPFVGMVLVDVGPVPTQNSLPEPNQLFEWSRYLDKADFAASSVVTSHLFLF